MSAVCLYCIHFSNVIAEETNTMVVTAFRTPVEAKEVGSSISIITEQEIKNNKAKYQA